MNKFFKDKIVAISIELLEESKHADILLINWSMAKSVRSKVRRRLRNCRAEHYYQTVGQYKLNAMSARLQDPTYDLKKEYSVPVNAFL